MFNFSDFLGGTDKTGAFWFHYDHYVPWSEVGFHIDHIVGSCDHWASIIRLWRIPNTGMTRTRPTYGDRTLRKGQGSRPPGGLWAEVLLLGILGFYCTQPIWTYNLIIFNTSTGNQAFPNPQPKLTAAWSPERIQGARQTTWHAPEMAYCISRGSYYIVLFL